VNDSIEFPDLKQEKKVKSLQMFKKPVQGARQGDRAAMCVAGFDSKALERGLVAQAGTVPTFNAAIIAVQKIRYYKQGVHGKSKWPITVGHTTVLARPTFFSIPNHEPGTPVPPFSWDAEYIFQEELQPNSKNYNKGTQFALLEFDFPVTVPLPSVAIGTRLDADINVNNNLCRLAFFGTLLEAIDAKNSTAMKRLRVYKPKAREGRVDRVHDAQTLLAKDLFKKVLSHRRSLLL